MLVPSAGKMLIEDTRAKPNPATQPSSPAGGDMRGATAFRWQKEMRYDDSSRQATMTGGVKVVHDGINDPTGQQHFELNADQIAAEIERKATTQPAHGEKSDATLYSSRGRCISRRNARITTRTRTG